MCFASQKLDELRGIPLPGLSAFLRNVINIIKCSAGGGPLSGEVRVSLSDFQNLQIRRVRNSMGGLLSGSGVTYHANSDSQDVHKMVGGQSGSRKCYVFRTTVKLP